MAGSENRKPWSDYAVLDRELRMYSKVLAGKPRLVVANKMDLPASAALLEQFSARHRVPIAPISCMTGIGLPELRETLWKAVREGKMPPGSIVPPVKSDTKKAKPAVKKAKAKAKPVAKKPKAKPAKARAKKR
jgi:GTP-binding protein